MALTKKQLIEKKYGSLTTPKGKEIFSLYFLHERGQDDIINLLKRKERVRDTQVLANLVSNYTLAWEELGYVIKRKVPNPDSKSKYHPNKNIYSATIKPFFDYSQKILSSISFEERIEMDTIKIPKKLEKEFGKRTKKPKLTKEEIKEYKETEFNEIEKKILEYIFSFKEVRKIVDKNENLIQGIILFLERIFFYETDNDWPHRINHFFRKGFFIKDKSHFKVTKEMYFDKLKEIKKFEEISFKYFRRLKNKIKLISKFNDQDCWDLIVNTSLRKYQYMPSLREIMAEKDPAKRHLLIRTWRQIYFFDEIPEGYS